MPRYGHAVFAALVAAVLIAFAPSAFAPNRRTDALGDLIGVYNWQVEIEGVTQGAVVDVQLPKVQRQVLESEEGEMVVTNPGKLRLSTLTLERGFFPDSPLKAWVDSVRAGNDDRRNVTVILMRSGRRSVEVARWNCFGCYPVDWDVRVTEVSRGKEALRERLALGLSSFTVTRAP